jgi:hypothetical protein
MHNFLIYGLNIDHLSPNELYALYAFDTAPVKRVDGATAEPHAPPYAVWSLPIETRADKLGNPIIKISDYGASFVAAYTPNPELCMPTLYRPPEALFGEAIVLPFAADSASASTKPSASDRSSRPFPATPTTSSRISSAPSARRRGAGGTAGPTAASFLRRTASGGRAGSAGSTRRFGGR